MASILGRKKRSWSQRRNAIPEPDVVIVRIMIESRRDHDRKGVSKVTHDKRTEEGKSEGTREPLEGLAHGEGFLVSCPSAPLLGPLVALQAHKKPYTCVRSFDGL